MSYRPPNHKKPLPDKLWIPEGYDTMRWSHKKGSPETAETLCYDNVPVLLLFDFRSKKYRNHCDKTLSIKWDLDKLSLPSIRHLIRDYNLEVFCGFHFIDKKEYMFLSSYNSFAIGQTHYKAMYPIKLDLHDQGYYTF